MGGVSLLKIHYGDPPRHNLERAKALGPEQAKAAEEMQSLALVVDVRWTPVQQKDHEPT